MLFCVLGSRSAISAQVLPPTILEIDVDNLVEYFEDTSDLSKFATGPNPIAAASPRNFNFRVGIGDIIAINGQPAKGTLTRNNRQVLLRTAPVTGQSIADTVRGAVHSDTFEIVKNDGTQIGTIMSYGLGLGTPPPGAPLAITQANLAIIGGTGAFIGARGQWGQAVTPTSTTVRQASVTEDPTFRRLNGGGRVKFVLQVIPLYQPQIFATSAGPAVYHADFSLVTAAKPATAGEVLVVTATGLGPTVPGVNPGQPFSSVAGQNQVNSPLDVSVNGQMAEVINAIGWPGLVDTYRVDFRVPAGTTAGIAVLQLTAAWIAGVPVSIAVQ